MRRVFRFKELIAIVLSITSSIYFIQPQKLGYLNSSALSIYSAVLNIVVLLLGLLALSTFNNEYYLIKRKHGEYDETGLNDLGLIGKVLNLSPDRTRYFVERTSALVGQLINNFSLFLWPLIIFYLINIIKDYFKLLGSDAEAHIVLDAFKNAKSYSSLPNEMISKGNVLWFLSLSGLANIFNFISAIGLWICFSILFQKTLDADNKSSLHFGIYYFLLIFYVLAYLVLLGPINIISIRNSILALDLFCAIFN